MIRGFMFFNKGIFPKVNVIAWQEFELAYYDSTVQCFLTIKLRGGRGVMVIAV